MIARSTRKRLPGFLTVVKDLLSFGAGLGLIIRQGWFVSQHDFNIWLLLFGGTLMQVPGISQILLLRTAWGQSPLPPVASSSPSSSSPSGS